jgi:hypothetical protein
MTDDQKTAANTLIALARMVGGAHKRGLLVAKTGTQSGSIVDMIKGLEAAANDAEEAGLASRRP